MAFIINESATNTEFNIIKKDLDTIEFITILQEADKPNRNNRIYPRKVLEDGLNSAYVRERLRTKTLLCEMGHPLDNSVKRQMTIDWNNTGCLIKEFWWEGNLLKGRCETTNTAKGRDLKGLIEQGVRIAFSLRAQGNFHDDFIRGAKVVESPLQIVTYDVVVNPSHSVAFLERICEETAYSLFKARKSEINANILTEATNLFQNGLLIETGDSVVGGSMEKDYTNKYTTNHKYLSEMYVPVDGDEVVSINESVTTIKNNDVTKKVVTEDFLVKDTRKAISELGKGEKPELHDVLEDLKKQLKDGGNND